MAVLLSYKLRLLAVTVLAVLVGHSMGSDWLRRRARVRADKARLRALEWKFPGRGFDVSAIASQIENTRRNYVAAAHGRSRAASCRGGLVAAARRLITRLSYFRHGKRDQEL